MEDDPLYRDRSVTRSTTWRLSYDSPHVVFEPLFGAVYSEFLERRSCATEELIDREGTGRRAELIDRLVALADGDGYIPHEFGVFLVWDHQYESYLRMRELT